MKYIRQFNEGYWNSRKERDNDIQYVKEMLSDLTDVNMEVTVNGYDLSRDSIIQSHIKPKYPEKNWPNHSYPKWNSIKYKIYQVLEMLEDRYEFDSIRMELRWGFGPIKDGECITFYTLESLDHNDGIKFDSDVTCISELFFNIKIKD